MVYFLNQLQLCHLLKYSMFDLESVTADAYI